MGILHIPHTGGEFSEEKASKLLDWMTSFIITLYLIALDVLVWNVLTQTLPEEDVVLCWILKIVSTLLIIFGIIVGWLPEKTITKKQ